MAEETCLQTAGCAVYRWHELDPNSNGGTRPLGIPTIEDRIAQQVVVSILTPILEPIFKEDSYGYRPGKGAH